MGNYFWSISGIQRDELQGGPGIPVDIWNINVGTDAVIERGQLLCADTPTGEFGLVSSAGDASKVLVIARDDFTADAEHSVTQAYASGRFNRERIKIGSLSTIEPFEDALRKSNIHLTGILDKF